ncbi:MAG: isoprenylcysteine carboxylmethyltransferase family protein [Bacteroidota bacterium]
MQYVWLVVFWGAYFLHHSLFSAAGLKEKLIQKGFSLRTQRLAYSLISLIGLFLILLYNGIIGGEAILMDHRLLKAFALFLAASGVFIVREAFKTYDFRAFVGLQNEENRNLEVTGILKHIRHPLYSATILIFSGFFLYDSRLASLVTLMCVLTYLPIGIWLEEKKLVKKFGQEYLNYSNKVPMLIPSLKRR